MRSLDLFSLYCYLQYFYFPKSQEYEVDRNVLYRLKQQQFPLQKMVRSPPLQNQHQLHKQEVCLVRPEQREQMVPLEPPEQVEK